MNKSTVSRVVDSVTDALVARKDQHIKWPMEIQQLNTIKEGFYKKAHFPNVIGCVDGTHVRIQTPTEDESIYHRILAFRVHINGENHSTLTVNTSNSCR
jgi:hypothetical protein